MGSSFVNKRKRIFDLSMDAMDRPRETAEKIVDLEDRVLKLAAENLSLQNQIDAFKFFEDNKVEKKRELPESVTMRIDFATKGVSTSSRVDHKATIQSGSIVRLKSGGPDMTVSHIGEDGRVADCQWFSDDGLVHECDFYVNSLVLSP